MKYMGSKNRHSKQLLSIILEDRDNECYVEPFVGGCNIIDKVDGLRIASDIHYYLIKMWEGIQDGWIPPNNISNTEYINIRNNKSGYNPALVGFVGFGCSYSGKWFGGYARGNDNKGVPRNYCSESRRNILKQVDNIKDIFFSHQSYTDMYIPDKSIIYCDPPYSNTTNYKNPFDHSLFWCWCEKMVKKGHKVFVSEYTAPSYWECLWSKKVNNSLTKQTGSKQGIEKLFTFTG